ncbi:MAG: Stage V sporulation protein D [Syntrophomonadaceae bacterium]|nr:Stage V sporulation protein D [Bacillota bacterium]
MGKVQVTHLAVKRRLAVLLVVLAGLLLLLVLRLGYIQLVLAGELEAKAWEQWNRGVPARAPRGAIFDREGRLMAGSAGAESVVALPAQITDKGKTARLLAPVLGIEEEQIYRLVNKSNFSVYLKRLVDEETAQAVRRLELDGITFSQEPRRFYPHGRLASQLLGFVGIEQGWGGIELTYDEELRGRDGRIEFQADGRGRQIPQGIQRFIPPEDGSDLFLTIDQTIQFIVEREMDRVMMELEPKSIMAVALDPRSGEVLAMAARPDFDPNRFAEFPKETWQISPISNTFEPGSTFKLVTLAAALEEGKFRAEEAFYCSGSITVAGRRMGCWTRYRGGHGAIDFTGVVLGSCNPGFVTLGQRIGAERLLQYVRSFGFGERTGIDAPGEGRGLLFTPQQFGPVEAATTTFGQGVSVTPIQQVAAIAAIANGGYLMRPYLVREIRTREGKVLSRKEPEMVRRVVSTRTAREVARIMELVITEGSGRNAYLEGYTIAGKTGTAQKVGPGGRYVEGEYILSFVGFAPLDEPRFLLYVAVDAPQRGPQWGSQVSAPMFRKIIGDVLKYLGVAPSRAEAGAAPDMVVVPDLLNLTLAEASERLEPAGLLVRLVGSGGVIRNQTPKPGARVPLHTQILVYLGEGSPGEQVTVPDLTGKTMREAGEVLGWLGLQMNVSGSGVAFRQSPAPFTLVEKDSVVDVEFRIP